MCKQSETLTAIPLDQLSPFPGHPFYVRDDEQMQRLKDSVQQVGVLVPIIVRATDDGNYQIISGHRRVHACEALGKDVVPAIIKDVDDDTATVMMVDSNFQREEILPSEKARAYKMKLEAIKHQGIRSNSASDSNCHKLKTSRELIAEDSPDGATMIQRYIRLTKLIPELLDMVDQRKIAITPAVELTFLNLKEQQTLLSTIESEQVSPSVSQAFRMKKLSKKGLLTDDMILAIMSEKKKSDCWNLYLPMGKVSKYFPSDYSMQKMQDVIFQLLDLWLAAQLKTNSKKR